MLSYGNNFIYQFLTRQKMECKILYLALVIIKLKQKFALVLCTIYTFGVIGIALSIYFCGDKVTDIALYTQ